MSRLKIVFSQKVVLATFQVFYLPISYWKQIFDWQKCVKLQLVHFRDLWWQYQHLPNMRKDVQTKTSVFWIKYKLIPFRSKKKNNNDRSCCPFQLHFKYKIDNNNKQYHRIKTGRFRAYMRSKKMCLVKMLRFFYVRSCHHENQC